MNAELFIRRSDLLGEGMLCLPTHNKLYWVDILGKKLMCANSEGTQVSEYEFDTEIGAVLPAQDHRVVVILRNSVALFAPETGRIETVWHAKDTEPASNRFNDANIDQFGNLWVGSMDFDAGEQTGALYRITPHGEAKMVMSGFRCLNGPVFSPDGRIAYLADTMAGEIIAFEFDQKSCCVEKQRIFRKFDRFEGLPDGMTVDSDGQVWVSQITAGRICRYNPSGTKTATVTLPVPMVTSCCFGGDNLSVLYATTARIILDDSDLSAYPDSGSIYRIQTAVSGQEPDIFGKPRHSVQ